MEQKKKYVWKYNNDYSATRAYKKWNRKYKKLNIPQRVHGLVMKDFSLALINLMLFHNFEFRMPYRLGYLSMLKKKSKPRLDEDGKFSGKGLPVDYGASYKLWKELYPGLTRAEINAIPNKKKIYHTNKHTDGHVVYLYWDKRTAKVKRCSMYSVKLNRTLELYKAAVLKNNPQLDFYVKQ